MNTFIGGNVQNVDLVNKKNLKYNFPSTRIHFYCFILYYKHYNHQENAKEKNQAGRFALDRLWLPGIVRSACPQC